MYIVYCILEPASSKWPLDSPKWRSLKLRKGRLWVQTRSRLKNLEVTLTWTLRKTCARLCRHARAFERQKCCTRPVKEDMQCVLPVVLAKYNHWFPSNSLVTPWTWPQPKNRNTPTYTNRCFFLRKHIHQVSPKKWSQDSIDELVGRPAGGFGHDFSQHLAMTWDWLEGPSKTDWA